MSNVLAKIQAAADSGSSLNWREMRGEIHDEHERSTTPDERANLLSVYVALMDLVENTDVSPDQLDQFRDTRRKDYNLLVVRECLVGEDVCTETLYEVTTREVEAGRMASDHELRVAAVNGMTAPHITRAELLAAEAKKRSQSPQKPSGWRNLMSKIRGR
jgi:hypothetical protein